MLTELERIDSELSRVEKRISSLQDDFFHLQRKADGFRDELAKEDDPRIMADLSELIRLADRQISENTDEQHRLADAAADLGLAYRAELAFQEARKIANAPQVETAQDATDDLLDRRKLRRERKNKIDGL